jgi:hypothetical protein
VIQSAAFWSCVRFAEEPRNIQGIAHDHPPSPQLIFMGRHAGPVKPLLDAVFGAARHPDAGQLAQPPLMQVRQGGGVQKKARVVNLAMMCCPTARGRPAA